MEHIRELQSSISKLEMRKSFLEQELKEEVENTLYNLRPSQLLKKGLSEITGKDFIYNPVGTAVASTTALLARGIFVRRSGNILVRVMGTILKRIIEKNILKRTEAIEK